MRPSMVAAYRGAQAHNRAKLVMGLGVIRPLASPRLGELERAIGMMVEGACAFWRYRRRFAGGPGVAEELVDRDRAARKRDLQPLDGRNPAVCRDVIRGGGEHLAEQRHRTVVIQVVGRVESPGPQCCGVTSVAALRGRPGEQAAAPGEQRGPHRTGRVAARLPALATAMRMVFA